MANAIKINDKTLTLKLPEQSITTLVIPVTAVESGPEKLLRDGCEYLIIAREETTRAITATGSKVTVEDIDYGDAQRWKLTDNGNGTYTFENALGLKLTSHRANNSSSLTAEKTKSNEQGFYIDEIDYPYFKILASKGRTHSKNATYDESTGKYNVNELADFDAYLRSNHFNKSNDIKKWFNKIMTK